MCNKPNLNYLLGVFMEFRAATPSAIATELGDRIKVARLNADLTQKELAEKAGLSLKAVTNSEKGTSTLESIVAILVALELTEQLNSFIPKQEISPVQLAKLQGKVRKRATGTSKKIIKSEDTPSW
ncbi:helix-turn-helix domain-containing protein [Algibacillus agarilyticus]|uniref:helix-turn-helix domain-containing protein n=1 Tax=Algibacillus agarilyticus TaxID=2234133 RepID=UPI0022B84A05|nr:helix-turn-helix transcriptional regulator [Algibacillus agarilyticus]